MECYLTLQGQSYSTSRSGSIRKRSKTTFLLLDKRFSGMLLWHRLEMFERHLAIEAGDYDHGTSDDL